MKKSHRELYPEQYTHPSIGKMATTKDGESGRIMRVMSTRWGPLAELDGAAGVARVGTQGEYMVAFRLFDLKIV